VRVRITVEGGNIVDAEVRVRPFGKCRGALGESELEV
jgi:hypothetical protein